MDFGIAAGRALHATAQAIAGQHVVNTYLSLGKANERGDLLAVTHDPDGRVAEVPLALRHLLPVRRREVVGLHAGVRALARASAAVASSRSVCVRIQLVAKRPVVQRVGVQRVRVAEHGGECPIGSRLK